MTPAEVAAMAALLGRVADGDQLACLDAAQTTVARLDDEIDEPWRLALVPVIEAALATSCAELLAQNATPAR